MVGIFRVFVQASWVILAFAVWRGAIALGGHEGQEHLMSGITAAVFLALTHSLPFIYFLGTWKAIEAAVEDGGLPQEDYHNANAAKRRSIFAGHTVITFMTASAVLGGVAGAHGGVWTFIHPCLVIVTLVMHASAVSKVSEGLAVVGEILGRLNEKAVKGELKPIGTVAPSRGRRLMATQAVVWSPFLYMNGIVHHDLGGGPWDWRLFAGGSALALVWGLRR
jgi:hypothetical protein